MCLNRITYPDAENQRRPIYTATVMEWVQKYYSGSKECYVDGVNNKKTVTCKILNKEPPGKVH